MVVPITLVIVLIASAFYTDIDAYDSRSLIMGTSMIALMSILPYLASTLPATTKTTFIHSALYACYGMMGISIVVIIVVSFFLSPDIAAAVKPLRTIEENGTQLDEEVAPETKQGCGLSWRMSAEQLRRKALRHSKLFRTEENIHCKPWVMRLYYQECAIFKRIMNDTATTADLETHLTYFAQEPALQRASSVLLPHKAPGGGEGEAPSRPSPRMSTLLSFGLGPSQPKKEPEDAPHLPKHLRLHQFLIELDLAMRFLVIGIYALVLLGGWGMRASIPMETFDCSKLVSYYADRAI